MSDSVNLLKMAGLGSIDPTVQQKFERVREQLKSAKEGSGIAGNPESKAAIQDKQAQKSAQDFEALLVQQMLKSMWNAVPKSGMFGQSNEAGIFRDMFNEQLANHIAENQSLGIKDIVLRDLERLKK